MGIFDEIRKEEPIVKQPVVKAKKKLHKGFLFGHISNGNGIVKLDDEYALKFIALDKDFVVVHLLDYGKDLIIDTQTWQKTIEKVKKKEMIEIEDNTEKSLF